MIIKSTRKVKKVSRNIINNEIKHIGKMKLKTRNND